MAFFCDDLRLCSKCRALTMPAINILIVEDDPLAPPRGSVPVVEGSPEGSGEIERDSPASEPAPVIERAPTAL